MMSHYVTVIIYLFINHELNKKLNKRKRKIKLRKIDKSQNKI